MTYANFSAEEILETVNMVRFERLDVRTITVGISLLDCAGDGAGRVCERIYDRVTRVAGNLRRVSEEIASEFGIPIVNNRVAVTPVALIAGALDRDGIVQIARALDRAAAAIGIDFIGGRSAGTRGNSARLRLGQRRFDARRHQHGRCGADGADDQAGG